MNCHLWVIDSTPSRELNLLSVPFHTGGWSLRWAGDRSAATIAEVEGMQGADPIHVMSLEHENIYKLRIFIKNTYVVI